MVLPDSVDPLFQLVTPLWLLFASTSIRYWSPLEILAGHARQSLGRLTAM